MKAKTFCGNSAIRSLDFYGKTLGFHYQGEDKLRSFSGAIISLIVFLAVCITVVVRLILVDVDSHKAFFIHGPISSYFEGANTVAGSDLSSAGLTSGEMTKD